ncbi:hypothetical protein [Chitinivorax sp. B]|uniref:hypothetical protein n=1 Tax=Chitinivorax sp. B TaxID=2502235 RepID=UPI0010F80703|nr:hypothetical protein [Chitinivorax sp. B]
MLPKNIDELNAVRDECKSLVMKRASLSAGAAIVPIPGIDLGADVTLLIEMIPMINRKFGLSPDQMDQLNPQLQQLLLVTITSIGSELVGKMITQQLVLQVLQRIGIRVTTKSVAKFVPILGQALSASISFAAMRLIGNSHINDCYEVAKKALLTNNPAT